ncbi:saccharopine dehydrogenase NADP-binding domain-containing protein [bacterium]|nr:saccharopine dehydrogenase NADP-binding domain-containing protein [bacterium]
MTNWMIYGANGYTGKLISERAKEIGLSPVIAGRNKNEIMAMANDLGFEPRVFGLRSVDEVVKNLEGIDTVLLCAGPFSATSRVMVDACIKAKVNYLDITGEIDVFESIFQRTDEFKQAGIAAMPGVGFDVVPTDCLAAQLKKKMPEATHLELAVMTNGGVSPGTLKTMVEGLGRGGRVRKDGKLTIVNNTYKVKQIPIAERSMWAVSSAWGDVATAYYSTDIPNIEVYFAMPRGIIRVMRFLDFIRPALRFKPVQGGIKKLIPLFVKGPNVASRERHKVYLYGKVSNGDGKGYEGRAVVPEGYKFTVISAMEAVERIRMGSFKGALTPSMAFGENFSDGLFV